MKAILLATTMSMASSPTESDLERINFSEAVNLSEKIFSAVIDERTFPPLPMISTPTISALQMSLLDHFREMGVACHDNIYLDLTKNDCAYAAVFEGYRRALGFTDTQANARALAQADHDLDVSPTNNSCIAEYPAEVEEVTVVVDGAIRLGHVHAQCLGDDGFLTTDGVIHLKGTQCEFFARSYVASAVRERLRRFCEELDWADDPVTIVRVRQE